MTLRLLKYLTQTPLSLFSWTEFGEEDNIGVTRANMEPISHPNDADNLWLFKPGPQTD